MACARWLSHIAGLATALATACASNDDLAANPPIQVVQTPSGLAFIRGDDTYDHGLLGCGLRQAVDGVPQAEEHAEAHSRLLAGGLLFGLGSAALTGASVATALQADDGGEGFDTSLALASGAVALSVVSSILYENGATHVGRAVDSYNEAVQRAAAEKSRLEPAPPGQGTSMLQRPP